MRGRGGCGLGNSCKCGVGEVVTGGEMGAEGRRGVERQLLYGGSQFMESLMVCADPAVSSIWLGHVSSSSMGVAKSQV